MNHSFRLLFLCVAWLAVTTGCAASWTQLKSAVALPARMLPAQTATARAPRPVNLGPAELDGAESAELCLLTAEQMERAGHDDQAAAFYERARQCDPDACPDYARRLAVLYDRLERSAEAQAEYEQAVRQAPNDPDLLNDYGVFHLRREQWTQAESWFRRALLADPQHERATVNLAIALGMQNRLQESFDTFAQVVSPEAAHANMRVLIARLRAPPRNSLVAHDAGETRTGSR